jgi:hypothetical protein
MVPEYPDLACRGPQQVAHSTDKGRLPRAVRSEQPEDHTVGDIQVEPGDGGESVPVSLREAAYGQRGLATQQVPA